MSLPTSRYTWTTEEIQTCPMFDNDVGWFYGLVVERGIPRLVEILPGMGYAKAWPSDWRSWRWAIRDVRLTPDRKAAYAGMIPVGTNSEILANATTNVSTWKPLREFLEERE